MLISAVGIAKNISMEPKTQDTYDGYLKALMDISRAITSDLYLEDILKLIVMVTAKVIGVDICSLWLVEDEGESCRIRLKATQALDTDYVNDRVLRCRGICGRREPSPHRGRYFCGAAVQRKRDGS